VQAVDIFQIIGVAIITTFAVLVLKPTRPEIAALVSIAGGIVVLMMFVNALGGVIDTINNIVTRTGINNDVFATLLRIIGIGYITEFAASICKDAGNDSMAGKVLLAGKVVILVLALPIVNNLIDIIVGII